MEHNTIVESLFPTHPIPFAPIQLPPFPVDALPKDIADYVRAVAESLQTPVDMPATVALAVLSLCVQRRFAISPKPDWVENLNLYVAIVMPPSERKSPVFSEMTKVVTDFQNDWNAAHDAEISFSSTQRSILEQRLKMLENMAAKRKASLGDVKKASDDLTFFREKHNLCLISDDATPEALTRVLAENGGATALLSPEGGIFDILRGGVYSKRVNIDVFLKSYSGDAIKVDRIGRASESVCNPRLTFMLMVQPSVLNDVMANGQFQGRGLTARFLYCVPESLLGSRKYRTDPIPEEVARKYEACICDLLSFEPTNQLGVIRLTPEADALLAAFSEELEPKLIADYADITEWAGKLVGNTARIAGLLCAAENASKDSIAATEPLYVSGETMANAIRIGRFFIEHAKEAFSVCDVDEVTKDCKKILKAIKKQGLSECSSRSLMRLCRSIKTAAAIQPAIDRLIEYGYLAEKPAGQTKSKGRPSETYLVNPHWLNDPDIFQLDRT